MLQLMNELNSHGIDQDFLGQYVPLVEFLGQALGPNTEIVLHDLDVPDQSIIAIANGHISGRQIGGPVTDFALWFMKQGDAAAVPMMTGYRAVNAEGKICHSSSYFLRDSTGHMRGMLCINVDISDLVAIRNAANFLIGNTEEAKDKTQTFGGYPGAQVAQVAQTIFTQPATEEEAVSESLRDNVENLLESMLDAAVATQNAPVDRMQRDERIEVVRTLEDNGFFLLKGGISAAAGRLGVSEPTIYRYLVKVRN
ncbi:TPA: PAS domain-containing protein [Corynebacterium striatum]|nr:PAS domain-containing protein [Corynebacterium striatum]